MHPKRTLLFVLLLLLGALRAPADHLRAHLLLSAKLEGAQEVPAVNTPGQGVASFTLNATRDTLFLNATFNNLSGPITGAHTHLGRRGASGPIVTDLLRFVQGNRLVGFLTGADLDNQKLRRYLRGDYYINVHTATNPGGEIRGQIEVETEFLYAATLTGGQETPPVSTPALGVGTFVLSQDKTRLKFRTVVDGLSGAITNTHFHNAAPGAAGPVILDLLPYLSGKVIEGEVGVTPAFVTALEAGNIYINVHTAANPGGEIRGQLASRARLVGHDARLDGAQMVPAVTTTAKAVALGELNAGLDTLRLTLSFAGLSGAPTSLDVYLAEAGQSNASATRLSRVALTTLTTNAFSVTFSNLNTAAANAFITGGVNLVLNTAANPNGEIRGQVYRVAREGYTFSLNGAQERPTPTNSPGLGSGLVSIDRDQNNAHFMLVWRGLTGVPTGGHFHTGRRNESGPVVFNLVPFFDNATAPTAAYGYWQASNTAQPFTTRRSIQFRTDSMYVNLHTAQFPGGEVRGQVFRGARNLQAVLSAAPAVAAESFAAFPSPFQSRFTLSFEARANEAGVVQITDLLGRTRLTAPVAVRPGANQVPLEAASLPSGVYLVTLRAGSSSVITRILKQ
ncbi:CHRD domain-containing protein [Hymenobacter aquaticus]|uniref:CHRD domain-containing protein n=1 Tax=Hymenobacter aquaticus TaxID=1867101 RepID=A0A4Z0Q5Z0_9BACT|nr:CHRD domain-containing protein [Hymenobacter aquaticus]TGE24839.1 CHRD domain-containing protein [Hymenobacter aquaticus]